MANTSQSRRTDLMVALALALLALLGSIAFYNTAHRPVALASDDIRGLFQDFYPIESDGTRTFRWMGGTGTVCLPAAAQQRPTLALHLDMLGQEPRVGVRAFQVQVGSYSWALPLLPQDRRYSLLVPHGPETGPVCVGFASPTGSPGDGRVLGVALRSISIWPMEPALPPLGQLLVNLALPLAGYWLLRRLGLPLPLAALGMTVGTLLVGAGLWTGRLRVAPDLPLWSAALLAGLTGLLSADLLGRGPLAHIRHAWLAEAAGVALTALLLGLGWWGMASLPGYRWPFPLMARAGAVAPEQLLPGLLPLALAAGWISLVCWLLTRMQPDERPTPTRSIVLILLCWLAACLLAVSLKSTLRGWDSLFQTFGNQPEDYIRDVPLVGNDPLGFLRAYVGLMPELALHNRNHPPGSTLFLWLVDRLLGPGPEPATWVAIAVAGLGVWPTYRLAERVAGPQVALLAAAIYGLLPAQLIYAATSMNAVYATILAFAINGLHAALGPTLRPWRAVTAGAWLALGFCFFFGTSMLALFAATLVLWRLIPLFGRTQGSPLQGSGGGRTQGSPLQVLGSPLANAVIVCGTLLGMLGLIYMVTGYSTLAALLQGVQNNYDKVQQRLPPPGPATYLFFVAANGLAYACYLGPWLVNRLVGAGRSGLAALAAGDADDGLALAAGLAVLLLGMLLSGLFTREVERIWAFTHMLVAFVGANGIIQQRKRLGLVPQVALILGCLFLQAFAIRWLMRLYW